MFGFLKKIFGTAQGRLLSKYGKIVTQVNRLEESFHSLSDEELRHKTTEFKERIERGETIDQLLPEAYAVVKNVCRRLCGTDVHVSGYDQKWDMVPYDVQIVGAIALHYGSIAEMQTGEGKTLTAAMPLYLNALTGKPVHLVTVNDYLAQARLRMDRRHLSLARPQRRHPDQAKRRIISAKTSTQADIVYGTASEFGFDYLRDNSMAQQQRRAVSARLLFCHHRRGRLDPDRRSANAAHHFGPFARLAARCMTSSKSGVAHLVRIQRDLCNRLATEARKVLEKVGLPRRSAIKSANSTKKKKRSNRSTPQSVACQQRNAPQ